MEIIKVFSDSYDEERLYSVLMDEEEIMMFSEIQKEFATAGTIKNGLRKLKRNIKVAGEEMSLVKPMVTGGDLTAKQVHALGRNQRLALLKNKTVRGTDNFGRPVKGKARDLIKPENIDAIRQAERKGSGMTRDFFRGYIPK